MSRKPIEYIAEIKHWWDKLNGNSYFSGRIYDLSMNLLTVIPFQYGDKSHSEDVITNIMWEANNSFVGHKHDISRLCYFNHQDELKKWCKQHGETPEWFEYQDHIFNQR